MGRERGGGWWRFAWSHEVTAACPRPAPALWAEPFSFLLGRAVCGLALTTQESVSQTPARQACERAVRGSGFPLAAVLPPPPPHPSVLVLLTLFTRLPPELRPSGQGAVESILKPLVAGLSSSTTCRVALPGARPPETTVACLPLLYPLPPSSPCQRVDIRRQGFSPSSERQDPLPGPHNSPSRGHQPGRRVPDAFRAGGTEPRDFQFSKN